MSGWWWLFRRAKKEADPLYGNGPTDDGVPLHRTYGVKRKKRPVRDFVTTVFVGSVLFYILTILGLALLATVAAIIAFIDILVATLFVLLAGSLLLAILTKTVRKRHKLERRIKKLCRKDQYSLTRVRKRLMSYSWNYKTPDLILETGGYSYHIHYLTVGHYNSALVFLNKREMQLIRYPLNNPFTIIFNLKPKIINLSSDFAPLDVEKDGKTNIRVVLVNPVCKEMYTKNRDEGMVATGNGFSDFGFTVYTGSGFCEAVERNEQELKNNK